MTILLTNGRVNRNWIRIWSVICNRRANEVEVVSIIFRKFGVILWIFEYSCLYRLDLVKLKKEDVSLKNFL